MILFFANVLGFFILIKTFLEIKKGKASEQWSTTQGVVTHAGIMNWRSSYKWMTTNREIEYFQYHYTVNNEKVFEARIFFGDFFLSMMGVSKPIKQAVLTYTPDQPVTVYYNPDKPTEAVLQPGVRQELYWGYAIGIGVIIAGFVYAFITGAQEAAYYTISLLTS